MINERSLAENSSEKKRAALTSLFAAFLLTGLKLLVGFSTGSLGILAEAAHSALDLVASAITFLAIRLSALPPDATHTYGHGKIESLAALAETLLLLLTCAWIVSEAIQHLFYELNPVHLNAWAFLILLLSIGVDFSRSRMLAKVAKKHKSQALEADALHFSIDMLSSLVVLLGLGGIWLADWFAAGSLPRALLSRADALAALIVAFIVATVSLRLGFKTVNSLMDAGSANNLKKVEALVEGIPHVLRISRLRLRESGRDNFIDLEIILPGYLDLTEAHNVTLKVEEAIQALLPEADITIHFEPEAESQSFLNKMRGKAKLYDLDLHNIEVNSAGQTTFITLHAEADEKLTLAEAHAKAQAFEHEVRAPQYEVLVHLEPRHVGENNARLMSAAGIQAEIPGLEQIILQCLQDHGSAGGIHKTRLLKTGEQLKLSFHCRMPGDANLRECHRAISAIERDLLRRCPDLHSVSIHAEPE
jgi:cation diffusion facilitator family transporter